MRVRHHSCVTLVLDRPARHVSRIHRLLRKGHYAERVSEGAPVYLAAVMEYFAAKVLELAKKTVGGEKAKKPKTLVEKPAEKKAKAAPAKAVAAPTKQTVIKPSKAAANKPKTPKSKKAYHTCQESCLE
ncbi:histone H2A, orphon-like [Topomyia yanbarensis]|uniref:histone H2A, orphon-like n=1 Tax=Topomyia yanbarensis TaxID=2498891 RepID=UPI00273CA300|nr:histone H2A, orphon-like [Topomyia yanbarensis]